MDKEYYRVIEIIDEYSILINYGSLNGASKGDEVRIIAIGAEVIDPISKSSLGTLDKVKAELTIVTVYDNFSVCQQIENVTKNSLLSPLAQLQITVREKKMLNVEEKDISNKVLPTDSKIRLGDYVEIL
jgi:hypothetical protein